MFAHINGVVAEKNTDSLVIDCGGVGYLLHVSTATLASAPPVGERMKCYTRLNVREDAMELFGFYSKEERGMFERLLSVGGVGSRTAIQVLSALSVKDLSIALVAGDANALTRVPGIGKKTAQRLVLELRDKIDTDTLTASGAEALTKVSTLGNDAVSEAIEALIALGYQGSEAAKAVSSVADKADKSDELIRLALKGMNA